MHLSDHDLRQMDKDWLDLPEDTAPSVCSNPARFEGSMDRLNQTRENSSHPPNLPLTNNPDESALRPMVIARNIIHGTRCASVAHEPTPYWRV